MTRTTEIITRSTRTPAGLAAGLATAAGIIALSLVTVACETDAPVPDSQADVVTDTIGPGGRERTAADWCRCQECCIREPRGS